MKRVCFDVGSNYFHNPLHGFLDTPDEARAYFSEETFRFHGATAYESSTRRFRDFTDFRKLFDFLASADEIITFNGRICDLIVLEKLIGHEAMQRVWQKPHHDIAGWRLNWKLENAVKELLPKLAPTFEPVLSERFEKIHDRFDNNTALALANTYSDTKFTYALFRLYEKSGDSGRTFREA